MFEIQHKFFFFMFYWKSKLNHNLHVCMITEDYHKLQKNIIKKSYDQTQNLKPWYTIGGFEWIFINRLKSAAFSLRTSENNFKPL